MTRNRHSCESRNLVPVPSSSSSSSHPVPPSPSRCEVPAFAGTTDASPPRVAVIPDPSRHSCTVPVIPAKAGIPCLSPPLLALSLPSPPAARFLLPQERRMLVPLPLVPAPLPSFLRPVPVIPARCPSFLRKQESRACPPLAPCPLGPPAAR